MLTGQEFEDLFKHLFLAVVWAILGVALFTAAFWTIGKISPFSIRKEIEEDQNTALAVLMGSMILGIAIIVAAAIH
jgi:putative membrane protein